jgi:hypothetical protein
MLDGDLGGSVFERLFEDALEDEIGVAPGQGGQRGAGIFGATKLVEDLVRKLVAVEVNHGVFSRDCLDALNADNWIERRSVRVG